MVMAISTAEERILSVIDALIGLLVGSSFMYWIGAAAEKALGKEALGQGDVKLMGCIGAFCGWEAAVFIILPVHRLGLHWLFLSWFFKILKRSQRSRIHRKIKFLGGGKSLLDLTSPLPPFFI